MALRATSSPRVTAAGSITGSSPTGAFTYGALTYSDTNNLAVLETSVNNYAQAMAQNASVGAAASVSFNVSNDQATSTTNYAEFGINSSNFAGTGSFSQGGYSYVASASTDLAIGTYGANGIHFVINNGASDTVSISSSGVTQIGAPSQASVPLMLAYNAGNNTYPVIAGGAVGGAFSTNFSNSGNEVDFWNTTTTANRAFSFYQQTGTSAATELLRITSAGTITNLGNPISALGSVSAIFGTGGDGTTTISSGTTTLARDMQYNNLTMSGTGILKTNGFKVSVLGTLDISAAAAAAIQNNGPAANNASGATGGAAVPGIAASLPGSSYTLATGGTGNTTTGTNPSQSATTVAFGIPAQGGAGGNGGTGVSAGGSGLSAQAINSAGRTPVGINPSFWNSSGFNSQNTSMVFTGLYGAPGGQGGGDGVNAGGGGGGAAPPGGPVYIAARFINRGGSTPANCITANGAAGGNGANGVAGTAGGGGGGGGGSGGMVYIVTEQLLGSSATNALQASGGTGGNGGNSATTGKGGNGGGGGGTGYILLQVLSAQAQTLSQPGTLGSAGGTTSTVTGAAGGAAANLQVTL